METRESSKDSSNVLEKAFKKVLDGEKDRREIGGYVLERVIDIDYYLSVLIEKYFVDDYSKKEQFNEFILEKEFFNFEQKRKILKKLKFEQKKEFEFDKETYKDLEYMQEVRNKIAHSLKTYDIDKKCFKITYIKNSKEKILFLDKEFVELFTKRADRVDKNISNVIIVLDKIKMEVN